MIERPDFFATLGVRPVLGRAFTPEETSVPGREAVVILSHEFWRLYPPF
jgi:hypothetical protein